MSYQARVIADSISPWGHRLTTMAITFPKMALAEFSTYHQAFICSLAEPPPISEQLRLILSSPFIPPQLKDTNHTWLAIPKGKHREARAEWRFARLQAATSVLRLMLGRELFREYFGAHADERYLTHTEIAQWLRQHGSWLNKLVANRLPLEEHMRALRTNTPLLGHLLAPFLWQEMVVSATEWDTFFLRYAEADSRPEEIQETVRLMREAYNASTPMSIDQSQAHRPLAPTDEYLDLSHHAATPFTWGEWDVRRAAARLYQRYGGSREWAGNRITGLLASTEFHGKLRGWRQLQSERS